MAAAAKLERWSCHQARAVGPPRAQLAAGEYASRGSPHSTVGLSGGMARPATEKQYAWQLSGRAVGPAGYHASVEFAHQAALQAGTSTEIDLCGVCRNLVTDEVFSICCDKCDRWVHGHCIDMDPSVGETVKK